MRGNCLACCFLHVAVVARSNCSMCCDTHDVFMTHIFLSTCCIHQFDVCWLCRAGSVLHFLVNTEVNLQTFKSKGTSAKHATCENHACLFRSARLCLGCDTHAVDKTPFICISYSSVRYSFAVLSRQGRSVDLVEQCCLQRPPPTFGNLPRVPMPNTLVSLATTLHAAPVQQGFLVCCDIHSCGHGTCSYESEEKLIKSVKTPDCDLFCFAEPAISCRSQ